MPWPVWTRSGPGSTNEAGASSVRAPFHAVALAVAGLLALTAFVLREPLLYGRTFYERDVQSVWYPQVAAFTRAVDAGSWPLWDPDVSFGHPMLAQPNTQVAYPPAWLTLCLAPASAYAALVGIHLLGSAIGVYALARRNGLSALAAFAAAAVWTGSGPYLSFVSQWHHFMGASWIPWVAFTADAALTAPTARRRIVFGAVLGLQLLAGSPDMVLYAASMAGLVCLARLARRGLTLRGDFLPAGSTLASAYGVALGISAVVWWPTLEIARHSARWNLVEWSRSYWSLHPAALLFLALPLSQSLMDLPLRPEIRAALFESREPLLYSIYLGLPALALAAAGVAFLHRRGQSLFLIVAVLSTLFALGRHSGLYALLTWVLPPLRSVRYPSKALILTSLAAAMLAGGGVDAWRNRERWRGRRRLWAVAALGVAVGAGTLAFLLARFDTGNLGSRLFLPVADAGATARELLGSATGPVTGSLIAAAVLFIAAVATIWRPRLAGWTAVVAVAVAVLDLQVAHRELNPTAPRELLMYRPPHVDAIRTSPFPRVWVYAYDDDRSRQHLGHAKALFADRTPRGWPYPLAQALALQMYGPSGMHSLWDVGGSFDADLLGLYPTHLDQLTRLAAELEGTPALLRLLQLGAVTHVVALHTVDPALVPLRSDDGLFREPIQLFAVPDPLPRVYAVSGARTADDSEALAAVVDPRFDFRRALLLTEGGAVEARAGFASRASLTVFKPDFERIEVDLSHAGFVVLVETFDPGWRASVDGGQVNLLRANVAFRAVRVPAGHHVIELRYRPRSITVGLLVSAASLLIIASLALLGWLRRLAHDRTPDR
jgi:hypothetical protein